MAQDGQPGGNCWARMDTKDLVELAQDGVLPAARELDRRGVPPEVVPAVRPVEDRSMDLALERAPNPGWLRSFAGTLRTEHDQLVEQAERLAAEQLPRCATPDEREHVVGRVAQMVVLAATFASASEQAAALADDLGGSRRPPAAVRAVPGAQEVDACAS